ncbi:MAG: hypothetical protein ACT4OD_05035 [Candidatus Nitrosotenuis sp.]
MVENLMPSSDKPYKRDDIVAVRYKFVGLKEEKIQCMYFQFENLKDLLDMEYCKIIEENDLE